MHEAYQCFDAPLFMNDRMDYSFTVLIRETFPSAK